MSTPKKVEQLKQVLDLANQAYLAKQSELIEQGYKSAERYKMLKDLKADEDVANSLYNKAAVALVKKMANAIIADNAPFEKEAKLARSPWKRAKANAAQKLANA